MPYMLAAERLLVCGERFGGMISWAHSVSVVPGP